MTQAEKLLLLKDLSARLPYGVMAKVQYKDGDGWKTEDRKIEGIYSDGQVYLDGVYTTIDCVKPYLRPKASMTEEEKEEYNKLLANCEERDWSDYNITTLVDSQLIFVIDWLNKYHFDYRGLIPMGLALEAKEGMCNM